MEKTKLQEVQNRMKEMKDKKAKELLEIQGKLEEARAQKEAAEIAIKEATESTNLEAYEAAKDRKRRAQSAIDMYSGRYKQIQTKEFISETESDIVIDSLLDYEKEIAAKFEQDIAAPLLALKKLYADYSGEVKATEETIQEWGRDIHSNYNTRGTSTYYDKETGKQTNRSPQPVPVHSLPYEGCSAGQLVRSFINGGISEFIKG